MTSSINNCADSDVPPSATEVPRVEESCLPQVGDSSSSHRRTMDGLADSLLAELSDPVKRRVRERVIAYNTAVQVKCPYCQVGPGTSCVTFPRGRPANFTHQKRVKARLQQMN
jgi:hypothetical protein